jgi:hypothetical protein
MPTHLKCMRFKRNLLYDEGGISLICPENRTLLRLKVNKKCDYVEKILGALFRNRVSAIHYDNLTGDV